VIIIFDDITPSYYIEDYYFLNCKFV